MSIAATACMIWEKSFARLQVEHSFHPNLIFLDYYNNNVHSNLDTRYAYHSPKMENMRKATSPFASQSFVFRHTFSFRQVNWDEIENKTRVRECGNSPTLSDWMLWKVVAVWLEIAIEIDLIYSTIHTLQRRFWVAKMEPENLTVVSICTYVIKPPSQAMDRPGARHVAREGKWSGLSSGSTCVHLQPPLEHVINTYSASDEGQSVDLIYLFTYLQ